MSPKMFNLNFQETVIPLEFVEKQGAPEPVDSLEHDDWVSAVQALNDL